MIYREGFEERERQLLSPCAARSSESAGRLYPEEKDKIRTDYQRDRDRIIHSKAFRRLMHKTQVFLSTEGDHFRTRLTHTIEVSQIARTIARGLALNEDLAEAIALGHDLGHTPFGHSGEAVLNRLHEGGFKHNLQSLRVVDVLEGDKGKNGRGLNLTYEVRDGIVCHTGDKTPVTLEGQIVRFSDRIAYINHDIDDALRSGVITAGDLPHACISFLGGSHSSRINAIVTDIIENSDGREKIIMSASVAENMDMLRNFMFENVYLSPKVKDAEKYTMVEDIIVYLYVFYVSNPGRLPDELRDLTEDFGLRETIKDFIAGMTDRYAINLYGALRG